MLCGFIMIIIAFLLLATDLEEKEAKQAATTEPLKTETKPVDAVKPPNSGKMSDLPVAGKNDTDAPVEGDARRRSCADGAVWT